MSSSIPTYWGLCRKVPKVVKIDPEHSKSGFDGTQHAMELRQLQDDDDPENDRDDIHPGFLSFGRGMYRTSTGRASAPTASSNVARTRMSSSSSAFKGWQVGFTMSTWRGSASVGWSWRSLLVRWSGGACAVQNSLNAIGPVSPTLAPPRTASARPAPRLFHTKRRSEFAPSKRFAPENRPTSGYRSLVSFLRSRLSPVSRRLGASRCPSPASRPYGLIHLDDPGECPCVPVSCAGPRPGGRSVARTHA